MNIKRILFVNLLGLLVLSSCGIAGSDERTDREVEREEFDEVVAEAEALSLVPSLPAGSQTLGFSQREPGVYAVTLNKFEWADQKLFAQDVGLVCVSRSRSDLAESCENQGLKSHYEQDGDVHIFIGSAASDISLDVAVGSDSTSLRQAFEAGWDSWIDAAG